MSYASQPDRCLQHDLTRLFYSPHRPKIATTDACSVIISTHTHIIYIHKVGYLDWTVGIHFSVYSGQIDSLLIKFNKYYAANKRGLLENRTQTCF